jgi:hypothetical protein
MRALVYLRTQTGTHECARHQSTGTQMKTGAVLAIAALAVLGGCSKAAPKIVVPEVFRVKFETSQGDFTVEAARA